jgi:hypothetical protein
VTRSSSDEVRKKAKSHFRKSAGEKTRKVKKMIN